MGQNVWNFYETIYSWNIYETIFCDPQKRHYLFWSLFSAILMHGCYWLYPSVVFKWPRCAWIFITETMHFNNLNVKSVSRVARIFILERNWCQFTFERGINNTLGRSLYQCALRRTQKSYIWTVERASLCCLVIIKSIDI